MKAKCVTIFLNEVDTWQGRPLHVALLRFLAESGIAGATVMQGIAGFTQETGLAVSTLSSTGGGMLPIVVEFIDLDKKIEKVLPQIRTIVGDRLIITIPADIIHGGSFHEGEAKKKPSARKKPSAKKKKSTAGKKKKQTRK